MSLSMVESKAEGYNKRKHENKTEFCSINTFSMQEAAGLSKGWVCVCTEPKHLFQSILGWICFLI